MVVQDGETTIIDGGGPPIDSNVIYVRMRSVVASDDGFLYELGVASGPPD